jgi:acylphosphatase
MSVKRMRVLVSGDVQGVFYRSECASRARAVGLAGSVRNLRDGRVEAVFEGDEQDVQTLVDWCRLGSPMARVDEVETNEEPPRGEREFRVTR